MKKESAAAAQASALGVAAALNLYVAAPDDKKPAALERLMKVAEFTEKNWPDRPEADDARMARGQAKLVVGQVREAIDIFERVNPKSERYPLAMYLAGQSYWRLYVTEKPKQPRHAATRSRWPPTAPRRSNASTPALEDPPEAVRAGQAAAEVHARNAASAGRDLQRRRRSRNRPPRSTSRWSTSSRPRNRKRFDANTIRIFLGAVRAYCALERTGQGRRRSAPC